MPLRQLGQILVDMGFIDDDQLVLSLEEQRQRPGEMLGHVAEELGLITDVQLSQALAEQMDLQVIELGDIKIAAEILELLTETMAQLYRVIPIHLENERITLATSEPQNITVQDELRTFLGLDVQLVVATDREITQRLEQHYDSDRDSIEKIVQDLEEDLLLVVVFELEFIMPLHNIHRQGNGNLYVHKMKSFWVPNQSPWLRLC